MAVWVDGDTIAIDGGERNETNLVESTDYSVSETIQATNNTIYKIDTTNKQVAQSITPSSDTTIDGVLIHIHATIFWEGDITVEVQTDDGDVPSGTLVDSNATATVSYTEISRWAHTINRAYAYYKSFIFNSPVSLTAGTKYWIVLKTTNTDASKQVGVSYHNAGSYDSGNMAISTDGGASWTSYSAYDIQMKTLVQGVTTSDYFTYDSDTKTLNLGSDKKVLIIHSGVFSISAGVTVKLNPTANGGNYLYAMTGGYLKINGTSSDHVSISQTTTDYYITNLVYLNRARAKLDFMDANVRAGTSIINVYGSPLLLARGGTWKNTNNSGSSYIVYHTSPSSWVVFNNVTFDKSVVSSGYAVYTTYDTLVFIQCTFKKATSGYDYAIYANMSSTIALYSNKGPILIDCTWDATNPVYSTQTTQGYYSGSLVNPTIYRNGVEYEGAVVSVIPQVRPQDLDPKNSISAPLHYYGIGIFRVGNSLFEKIIEDGVLSAVTDSNGKPQDEHGFPVLFMIDKEYRGKGVPSLVNYYGGSKTEIRPWNDTTWNNDGTDYGWIVMAGTNEATGPAVQVVDPSSNYTGSLNLGGDLPVISNESISTTSITTGETVTVSCDVTNMTSNDEVYAEINGKVFKLYTTDNASYSRDISGLEIGPCTSASVQITAINSSGGTQTTLSDTLTVTADTSVSSIWGTVYNTINGNVSDPLGRGKRWVLASFPDIASSDFPGFPIIVIDPASVDKENTVFDYSTKSKKISITVTIFSNKVSILDELTDEVIEAMESNESSFVSSGMNHMKYAISNVDTVSFGKFRKVHIRDIEFTWDKIT